MLPYFFRHYDTLVSRYFVFDDGSTDRSVDLLNAHPKVTFVECAVVGSRIGGLLLRQYKMSRSLVLGLFARLKGRR
jgi:hypothetical protein